MRENAYAASMPDSPDRVAIWGLGTHDGGASAIRFFVHHGSRIRVVDAAPAETLALSLDAIADIAIEPHFGTDATEVFDDVDLVVVNPAISPSHWILDVLRERGVPLTTELALTVQTHSAPQVVVTGSAGKSTTAARLATLSPPGEASSAFSVGLGGNFERDLLDLPGSLLDQPDGTFSLLVLEVSSFQAAQFDLFELSGMQPSVAVLTSLEPNHLDWHGDYDAYAAAKWNLLRRTRADGCLIVADTIDEVPADIAADPRLKRVPSDAAAIADAVAEFLAPTFGSLEHHAVAIPHRQQTVVEVDGMRFVNDSAATTPASTLAALDAFNGERVGLILGGRNKGFDLDALARSVAGRCVAVATIGETAADLAKQVAIHGGKVRSCRTIRKAAGWLQKILRTGGHEGGVVLLSPGMSSLDQYDDYRFRGEDFAEVAQNLR